MVPQSSGLLESITSIPGRIAGSISSAFRSPERELEPPAAAKSRLPAQDFKDIVQPPKWPWHLPEISREEVERNAVGTSRKRSASKEPGSPSKRLRH